MRPQLTNTLFLLPLPLLLLVLLLWVLSYLPYDDWHVRTQDGKLALILTRGSHYLSRGGDNPPFNDTLEMMRRNRRNGLAWQMLGFEVIATRSDTTPSYALMIVPIPYLVLILGGLSVWSLLTHPRRSRRCRPNLCPSCGYDLRATPDRCPECGHVPASSTATVIRADS